MTKSLVLTSPQSLDGDVMPMMLSDGIFLDANDAHIDTADSLLKVADYVNGLLYSSPSDTSNPIIIPEANGNNSLRFPGNRGLKVEHFPAMSGTDGGTFYLVGRFYANASNDIYFRWGAVEATNGEINKSIFLRRAAGGDQLQFTYDPGPSANVASVLIDRGSSSLAIISCGFSIAHREVFIRFNNAEVLGVIPAAAVAIEADGPLSIGYNSLSGGAYAEMDLFKMHAFNQYHTPIQRGKVIASLAAHYGAVL